MVRSYKITWIAHMAAHIGPNMGPIDIAGMVTTISAKYQHYLASGFREHFEIVDGR